MTHTYATVDQFKAALSGNVSGLAATEDANLLAHLESASRAVEAFVNRSAYGSGFGPRVASNRYEGDGSDGLALHDDFQGAGSITVYSPPTASSPTYTLAADTDFYLEPYSGPPYRHATLHGYGALGVFPDGSRVLVAGTAGYANTTTTTALTYGTAAAAATTINVSAGSVISAGHTLRYGSEDIYVTAVSSGTVLTVLRGQNGTTAAAIPTGGTVVHYTYEPRVVTATLAVAQRRRKGQDAGLTGDFGVDTVTTNRDTERSLLRAHLGALRVYGAG